MGVPNPCCGMSLQIATEILAIIQIVMSVLSMILAIAGVTALIALQKKLSETDTDTTLLYAVMAIGLVVAVLGLALAVTLFLGAKQRSLLKCRVWCVATTCMLVVSIAGLIVISVNGGFNVASVTISVIDALIRLYMIWVVFAFIAEIKKSSSGVMPGTSQF